MFVWYKILQRTSSPPPSLALGPRGGTGASPSWSSASRSSCWCAAAEPFLLPVCRPLTITGKVLPVVCHIACMPHFDFILRHVHAPLLNAMELCWKKCFLRPLSVIPTVLSNTGFSVCSWHFHNIFGMLQSLVSLFINCQIVIASPGLRLKRKIEL